MRCNGEWNGYRVWSLAVDHKSRELIDQLVRHAGAVHSSPTWPDLTSPMHRLEYQLTGISAVRLAVCVRCGQPTPERPHRVLVFGVGHLPTCLGVRGDVGTSTEFLEYFRGALPGYNQH